MQVGSHTRENKLTANPKSSGRLASLEEQQEQNKGIRLERKKS